MAVVSIPSIPSSVVPANKPQTRTWVQSIANLGSFPVSWLWNAASTATAATAESAAMPGQINNTLKGATELTGQLVQTADTADKFMQHTAMQFASVNGAVQDALASTVPGLTRDVHVVSNATAGTANEATVMLKNMNQGFSKAGRAALSVLYFATSVAGVALYSHGDKLPEGNRMRQAVKIAGVGVSAVAGLGWLYRMGKGVAWGKVPPAASLNEPEKSASYSQLNLDADQVSSEDIEAMKNLLNNEYSSISQYFEYTVFPQIDEYNAKLASPQCPMAERPALNQKLKKLAEHAFSFFKNVSITDLTERRDAMRLRQDFVTRLQILKLPQKTQNSFLNDGLPPVEQFVNSSGSATPGLMITAAGEEPTAPPSSASDASISSRRAESSRVRVEDDD